MSDLTADAVEAVYAAVDRWIAPEHARAVASWVNNHRGDAYAAADAAADAGVETLATAIARYATYLAWPTLPDQWAASLDLEADALDRKAAASMQEATFRAKQAGTLRFGKDGDGMALMMAGARRHAVYALQCLQDAVALREKADALRVKGVAA